MTGTALLNPVDSAVFEKLQPRFRFKDVKAVMGGHSDSNVKRFLDRCCALEIARRDGAEYVKVNAVERME
jgi:hypothetical protein